MSDSNIKHDFDHNNFIIIISSPSGAGKTTICNMIRANDPSISLSISATTRKKRPDEINGQDYYFLSKKEYDNNIKNNQFIEYAEIFGNYYGSFKSEINRIFTSKKDVLFDIDWQGARQISDKFSQKKLLKIFILPPSLEELKKRLLKRNQDEINIVNLRMSKAKDELDHFNEYDYLIINHNLHDSYNKIKYLIEAKRMSNIKKEYYQQFIQNL